jgi:hypothetical protein
MLNNFREGEEGRAATENSVVTLFAFKSEVVLNENN